MLNRQVFNLSYQEEIATICFEYNSKQQTIKLPIHTLKIKDRMNNSEFVLKPNIETVNIEKHGSLTIFTLNINFSKFLSAINKLNGISSMGLNR